jgi:hypothetical protein
LTSKSLLISIFLGIIIILITSTTFQPTTNHYEKDLIFVENGNIKFVFAQTNNGGNGGVNDDDDGTTPPPTDGDDGTTPPPTDGDDGTTPPPTDGDDGTTPPPTDGDDGTTPPPANNDTNGDHDGRNDTVRDHDRRDYDGKRHYKEVIKIINNNIVIVRGFDNIEKEIFVIGDGNTCPSQSGTVTLTGKISPKEIRLLGDFLPCYIEDGSVTLNIPDTQNIKLAVLYIDENGDNYQSALINPIKIQNINNSQALFTIDLDPTMTGINPNTGQRNTLTNINGLALYNDGNSEIQFKSAGNNIAALTATFTK